MNFFSLFRNKTQKNESNIPVRAVAVFEPNQQGPLAETGRILSGYEGSTQVVSDLDNKGFANKVANKTHVIYYDARDGLHSCTNRTCNPNLKEQFSYIYFDEEDGTHLIFMHLYLAENIPKHSRYGAQAFHALMDSNIEDINLWTERDASYQKGGFVAMWDNKSDNLHAFVKYIRTGMTVVEAARSTFTGKMLFRNGYKYISRVVVLHDEEGNVSYVYVFFDNHVRTSPYDFLAASRFLD
ncbi:MAG: hypothetical protein WC004_04610 [Candidatus Absconditabacterales bacterium]